MINIVDSSAWLEYFADTKNAKNFVKAIENTDSSLVPVIILYEVFKKLLLEADENTALRCVAHMKTGKVIDVDVEIALHAGKLSATKKIPMADSIILAIAEKHGAIIWTQDADFKGLKNVKYFAKS